MDCWFQGIKLAFAKRPSPVVLPNNPSMNEDSEAAAAELGRLASLGGTHWREDGSYPPDRFVCPSHLIVKGDKVRVAHDWSNYQYPLNSALANPPEGYGAMDGFLELLSLVCTWVVLICRTAPSFGWLSLRAAATSAPTTQCPAS